MATLRIEVKDGKFIGHNGIRVKEFRENYVCANGWKCTITPHGVIVCMCREKYLYGEQSKKFILREGQARLTLKTEYGGLQVVKQHELGEWPLDGTIGLSSGNIVDRRAYYRPRKFQEFLDKHKITAVSGIDPNKTYSLEEYKNADIFLTQKIISDGEIEFVEKNYCTTEVSPDEDHYKFYQKFKVTGATWVIISSDGDKGESSVIYTLRDVISITDIPEKF